MANNLAPICQTFADAQFAASSLSYDTHVLQGLVPAFYRLFYETDVKRWLHWYDGYVPAVHSPASGIISTNIAKTIVDRTVETVFAGGIMYRNADKPKCVDENGISISLSVIADQWAQKNNFAGCLKRVCKFASAGGTALLKLNQAANGHLWIDTYRTDHFFPVLDAQGNIESVKAVLTTYTGKGENGASFALVEERYFKNLKWSKRVPVRLFSVYRASRAEGSISLSQRINWKSLPNGLKEYLRKSYSSIRIDEEQILPFTTLGCYAFRYTDGCDRYNGVALGESMLHPVMQYLLSYDYYFSAFNTDMYLGRGRVIAKRQMQTPGQKKGQGTETSQNHNAGLDSFMYDQLPTFNTDEQKPTPIQFDLRAAEWREIRNNLIESMAFALGISVGTLASFLNDTSNRTAREVSAEESATARFVEARRAQFEKPANDCLRDVCLYYGLQDIITVRWSLSGQTNIDALSTRVTNEYQTGVRSLKSTVAALNPDMDEQQVQDEVARIEREQSAKTATMFGDIGGATDLI